MAMGPGQPHTRGSITFVVAIPSSFVQDCAELLHENDERASFKLTKMDKSFVDKKTAYEDLHRDAEERERQNCDVNLHRESGNLLIQLDFSSKKKTGLIGCVCYEKLRRMTKFEI